MSSKVIVNTGGIGIGGLLLVALIVLKLTNVITWSWWWVISPIWIPAALVISVMIFAVIVYLCIMGIGNFIEWYKNKY